MSGQIGSYTVGITAQVNGAQQAGQQISSQVSQGADDAGDKLKDKFSAMGKAAALAFGASLYNSISMEADLAKVNAQLGLNPKESAAYGKVAGELYTQAYGESTAQIVGALASVDKAIAGSGTKKFGDDLQGVTKDALNFADTFDMDVNEALMRARNLVDTKSVKDYGEAFDVLAGSAQEVGPALTGDLFDAQQEYTQFFSQLGLNAQTSFGVLVSQSELGMFGIDKAGDAMKEFGIRAKDMSSSSVEAYEALGMNAEKSSLAIAKGGESASKVTGEVAKRLLAIKNPMDRSNTAIKLFGGQFEDLGQKGDDFLRSLRDSTSGVKDFGGTMSDIDKTLGGTTAASLEKVKRGFLTAFAAITTEVLPVLQKISDFATEHPAAFKAIVAAITVFAAAWAVAAGAMSIYSAAATVAAVAQWAMNSALLASPITWLVLGIVAIIAALVIIEKKTGAFSAAWKWAWDGMKAIAENFMIGLRAIGDKIGQIWNSVKQAFAVAWNWVANKAISIVNTFQSVKSRITGVFTGMFDGLKNAFRGVFNFIARGWNSIHFTIPSIDTHIPGIGEVGGMTVDPPNIPYLATGGITTGPTLAVVGDNPGGREAIIPLDKLKTMVEMPNSGGEGRGKNVTIYQTVPVQKNMMDYYLTTRSAVQQAL